jgi:hypothetical protein
MTEMLTVHVPMTFRRRGGRKLIVSPDGTVLTPATAPHEIDGTLLKAVARAFRWRKLLDTGVYSSIKEIAAKEKIDPSYVGDVHTDNFFGFKRTRANLGGPIQDDSAPIPIISWTSAENCERM